MPFQGVFYILLASDGTNFAENVIVSTRSSLNMVSPLSLYQPVTLELILQFPGLKEFLFILLLLDSYWLNLFLVRLGYVMVLCDINVWAMSSLWI